MENDRIFTDTELLDFLSRSDVAIEANLFGYNWVLINEKGEPDVKGDSLRDVLEIGITLGILK